MTTQAPAGRRRLLPRLNLATLLVLVAAVGGPMGWYIHGVRSQRQAVRALRDAGARVLYDWELDPDSLQGRSGKLAGWRRIVAERFGPDAVASVGAVLMEGAVGRAHPVATDEHIAQIGRLKSLRLLHLGTIAVTEAGAAPIAGLEQLRILVIEDIPDESDPGPILSRLGEDSRLESFDIMGSVLDEDDFAAISRLPHLETLRLKAIRGLGNPRKIVDADLAKLSGLRLRRLELPYTEITSEGLKSIEGMKSLEILSFDSSSIDDLAPLRQLPALKHLDLGFCLVGDGGLSALGGMPGLESLSLGSDSITAAGLEPLAAIKTLKRISLDGSKITPEQCGEFTKAHPGIALQARRGLVDDLEVSTID